MDKAEAKQILIAELAKYRSKTYAELKRLLSEQDSFERTGPTGKLYQLEVQGVWESEPDANLRVIGSIDDGGIAAFKPLSDSFIISSEGKFIGE